MLFFKDQELVCEMCVCQFPLNFSTSWLIFMKHYAIGDYAVLIIFNFHSLL